MVPMFNTKELTLPKISGSVSETMLGIFSKFFVDRISIENLVSTSCNIF